MSSKNYSLELWREYYVPKGIIDSPLTWNKKQDTLKWNKTSDIIWESSADTSTYVFPKAWKEERVAILADNKSENDEKAFDIQLTKDVYGELNLVFSINGLYIDRHTGIQQKNYLIDLILNESKIKLFFDEQWYDFVVKDINETHNQSLTIQYNCIQLAAYELSKIGYEKKFSVNDSSGSAINNASYFMENILSDCEWKYLPAGMPPLQNYKVDLTESNEEIGYFYELKDQFIDLYDFSFDDSGKLIKSSTPSHEIGGFLVIPYSQLNKYNTDIFIFYSQTENFELQDYNYIGKNQLKIGQISNNQGITPTRYIIQTPKNNFSTEYILYIDYENPNNTINQYAKKIQYNGNQGYCREVTRTPDYGYEQTKDSQPSQRYYTHETFSKGQKVYYSYIDFDKNQHDYSFIVEEDIPINSYLDFYVDKNNSSIGYIHYENAESYWQCVLDDNRTEGIVVIAGVNKKYYTRINLVDGNFSYIEHKDLNSFLPNTIYYEISFDKNKFEQSIDNNIIYTINHYFTISRNANNDIKEINTLGYGKIDEPFFYTPDVNGKYYYNEISGEYTLTQTGESSNKYSKVYFDFLKDYNMIRTLEAEKSNCFNLTQTVAETFGVWCRYVIEHDESGRIKLDKTGRRKKWVTLTNTYGEKNQVGFTYGININSLTRNIETNNLVTKLYVNFCENSVAKNGYVAIEEAENNISKEPYIYNFDYFIQKKFLDGQEVALDLYNIPSSSFDPLKDTSYISGNNNAAGYLIHLQLLNKRYNYIQNEGIGQGENNLLYQITKYKQLRNTYQTGANVSNNSLSGSREEDQQKVDDYNKLIKQLEAELDKCYQDMNLIKEKKRTLYREFNQKYARFIQEGSWSGNSYIDNNTYYNDALKVSSDAAKPSISYTIGVDNLNIIKGYELFDYHVGDQTWIEDTEYFGYDKTGKPYHEAVIVTEISYKIDNQNESTITITNHSNRFEDLFQRLTASVQSYNLNEQKYNRTSNITTSGALEYISLQESFNKNKQLTTINNDLITSDSSGITVRNADNPNQLVKIVSGGIILSEDGGNTFTTGIYAGNINTGLLKAGQINTERIKIASTGGAGAIIIENQQIDMFSVAQGEESAKYYRINTDQTPSDDKIYYLKKDGKFVSADTSLGFKTSYSNYYVYTGAYLSRLQFSPEIGIRMTYDDKTRFSLDRQGNLTATNLQINGGDIKLYDQDTIVTPNNILVESSKIILSNTETKSNQTVPIEANYGSYGFQIKYNGKIECGLYSNAVVDGASLRMCSRPGNYIVLQNYSYGQVPQQGDKSLSLNQDFITFSRTTAQGNEIAILDIDKINSIHKVFIATENPNDMQGSDGDLWLVYR